jgi:hypothetical protein
MLTQRKEEEAIGSFKCSITSITNPNPFYDHSIHYNMVQHIAKVKCRHTARTVLMAHQTVSHTVFGIFNMLQV